MGMWQPASPKRGMRPDAQTTQVSLRHVLGDRQSESGMRIEAITDMNSSRIEFTQGD